MFGQKLSKSELVVECNDLWWRRDYPGIPSPDWLSKYYEILQWECTSYYAKFNKIFLKNEFKIDSINSLSSKKLLRNVLLIYNTWGRIAITTLFPQNPSMMLMQKKLSCWSTRAYFCINTCRGCGNSVVIPQIIIIVQISQPRFHSAVHVGVIRHRTQSSFDD